MNNESEGFKISYSQILITQSLRIEIVQKDLLLKYLEYYANVAILIAS